TGIPNARVCDAMEARALIADANGPPTVAEIRAAVGSLRLWGVDPSELWDFAEAYGYSLHACPSAMPQRGCFDVVFWRPSGTEALPVEFPGHSVQAWSHYANDPVRGKLMSTLV